MVKKTPCLIIKHFHHSGWKHPSLRGAAQGREAPAPSTRLSQCPLLSTPKKIKGKQQQHSAATRTNRKCIVGQTDGGKFYERAGRSGPIDPWSRVEAEFERTRNGRFGSSGSGEHRSPIGRNASLRLLPSEACRGPSLHINPSNLNRPPINHQTRVRHATPALWSPPPRGDK